MTTADLSLEMSGCQGLMDNITTGTLGSLIAYGGCSLLAEDLTLESQEDEIYGWIMNSNLTLRRMSVISDNGSLMGLSTLENGSLAIESSTFHDCVLDIWSYDMNNMTLSIADCDFKGEASGLKISWDPAWESAERAFLNGSFVEGNRFHGGDLVCPPAIADLYVGNNSLGPGSRYIMWFYGYVDTEGMPENATQVRSYIDSDMPSSELGKDALGTFYNQWSGLFVEGSLAPPHFIGEPVVHYYFVAEISSYQGKWVFDFASVPLPPSGEPVRVLEWDDVTVLVQPLVQP